MQYACNSVQGRSVKQGIYLNYKVKASKVPGHCIPFANRSYGGWRSMNVLQEGYVDDNSRAVPTHYASDARRGVQTSDLISDERLIHGRRHDEMLVSTLPYGSRSDAHLETIRSGNETIRVRLEVFTAVAMKNGIFWDVTPCGSCKNRRFGGT
jgi:hypothetical protein